MYQENISKRELKLKYKIRQLARDLRNNPTAAERAMWNQLRSRQFMGLKFRRQFPIYTWIVDFYCHELKLVIEIDGDIHDHQVEKDQNRDMYLNKSGYKVIRFKNDQVLFDMKTVLKSLQEIIFANKSSLPLQGSCPPKEG